jgi:hypothetical protein
MDRDPPIHLASGVDDPTPRCDAREGLVVTLDEALDPTGRHVTCGACHAELPGGRRHVPAPEGGALNVGHGHVRPRPDGMKARCGGPGICSQCSREAALRVAREGSTDD